MLFTVNDVNLTQYLDFCCFLFSTVKTSVKLLVSLIYHDVLERGLWQLLDHLSSLNLALLEFQWRQNVCGDQSVKIRKSILRILKMHALQLLHPHSSDKVCWKGQFYLVRNENPLGGDSLPFCNLYTRNPNGLGHCAVDGFINLYPMEWMSRINGFGCLSCLITWSHPLIMMAGSELRKQLPITIHAVGEHILCTTMNMCNYVSTWKPVVAAHFAVNWAAVEVNGLWAFCFTSLSMCESVCEFASVWPLRVKCSLRATSTPDPSTTPIYPLLSLCVAWAWLSLLGSRLVWALWMCSGDILTKSALFN